MVKVVSPVLRRGRASNRSSLFDSLKKTYIGKLPIGVKGEFNPEKASGKGTYIRKYILLYVLCGVLKMMDKVLLNRKRGFRNDGRN